MTVATEVRNPESLKRSVAQWVASTWVGATDIVIGELAPFGTGASSEAFLLKLESATSDIGHGQFVVRTAPVGVGIFPDYDFAEQVRLINALGSAGAIVPAPAAFVAGATREDDIIILPRVFGDVPSSTAAPYTKSGWVAELSPEGQRHFVESFTDALAFVHSVDPASIGVAAGVFGKTPGVAGEFQWYSDYFDGVAEGLPADLIAPIVEAREWFIRTMPTPDVPNSVVWGDSRFGNVIFDENQNVVALLDWEMANIGPAEIDFGFQLAHRKNSALLADKPNLIDLDGAPTREEQIARYEAALGRKLQNLEWFEAFGGFRLATMHMALRKIFLNSDTTHWNLPPVIPGWVIDKMAEHDSLSASTKEA